MTGGGVFPALAVLQAVKNKTNEILWIGSEGGMESRLLKDQDLRFETIPAAGLHGVGLPSLPGNMLKLIRGFKQANKIIRDFKPDVLFFTGGYLGVPVAYAGRQIPSVVFVPDIEPGLALKEIIRSAQAVAVSVPDSKAYIKHPQVGVSGYPVRKELSRWTRTNARKHFGMDEKDKALLVFGGSKGARSINQALLSHLEEFLKTMHVIHISGRDNWEESQAQIQPLDESQRARYHAYPFLEDEMGAAFAAADLAVCRAGASTLGELPLFGLTALLVPYPHAWRYQYQNAEYLQSHGGARILKDEDLGEQLLPVVMELINDKKHLAGMRTAMKSLSHPDAAEAIAEMIVNAGQKTRAKEALYG
jgi:UDP-N-acetylglucosamine--N-acetylmuramyl-(pentapeptide) pyrophosphoryl-undecaprenol N-acetylglucosamine transferase